VFREDGRITLWAAVLVQLWTVSGALIVLSIALSAGALAQSAPRPIIALLTVLFVVLFLWPALVMSRASPAAVMVLWSPLVLIGLFSGVLWVARWRANRRWQRIAVVALILLGPMSALPFYAP
jgi:hypothetical protein